MEVNGCCNALRSFKNSRIVAESNVWWQHHALKGEGKTISASKNTVDTSASTILESVARRRKSKSSVDKVGFEMSSTAAVGLPLAQSLATILFLGNCYPSGQQRRGGSLSNYHLQCSKRRSSDTQSQLQSSTSSSYETTHLQGTKLQRKQ